MANGIDWFRWHHGSVNDPKFGLVAKKAGARVGDVITVWALILEQASASNERGEFGEIDGEATDFLLGADDGTTARILEEMQQARGLISGQTVTRWQERQPKRERVDTTATDRKRAQRERSGAQTGDAAGVTPCHAESHHVTPREEERREEKKETRSKTTTTPPAATFDPLPELAEQGVLPQTAADWLAFRKSKRAPVTPTVMRTMIAEAGKCGLALDAVLSICCTRGWIGFEADWVLKDQRAGPGPQYQTANEKAKDLAERLTGKKHAQPRDIIDLN